MDFINDEQSDQTNPQRRLHWCGGRGDGRAGASSSFQAKFEIQK